MYFFMFVKYNRTLKVLLVFNQQFVMRSAVRVITREISADGAGIDSAVSSVNYVE